MLQGSKIGVEGAKALCKALKVNKSLTQLVLSYNKNVYFVVKVIIITTNNIGNEGAKTIAEVIKISATLTELYLCNIVYKWNDHYNDDNLL